MAGKKCGAAYISATKECKKGRSGSRSKSSGAGSFISSASRLALLAGGLGAAATIASRYKRQPERPKYTNSGKKMTRSMEAKLKKMQGLKHGAYEKYKISSTKSVQMPYYSPTSDLQRPSRRMFRADKKCGNSGIPDNAKCSKSTASAGQAPQRKPFSNPYLNNVLKVGAGGVALTMGAAALGSLGNKGKAKPGQKALYPSYKAPSVPKKKTSSIRKRLEEIKRKNKENPGRSEIRDLRALGMKAERQVGRGVSPQRAIRNVSKINIYKNDELTREDKKCGNSGIPDNAKCTKQTAPGQPQANKKAAPKKGGGGLNVGGILGAAAIYGGLTYASNRIKEGQRKKQASKRTLQKIKNLKAKGNDSLIAALKAAQNASDMAKLKTWEGQEERLIEQAKNTVREGMNTRNFVRAQVKQSLSELKTVVPKSAARRRKEKRGPVTGGLTRRTPSVTGGLARRS